MPKICLLCSCMALLVLPFSLGACNLPRGDQARLPTPNGAQVMETVHARLTQAVVTPLPSTPLVEMPVPTLPPILSSTSQPTENPTNPTDTPRPTALCDQAAAGNPIDVTIPDDTEMKPGQAFTKTWRLLNVGACTWTSSYHVEFFSGDDLGASTSVPLPANVSPGQPVDVSIDMVAPQDAGKYQGFWKLRNADNAWFGIGPGGGSPFWVRIIVIQQATTT